ncbi:MAG: TonB-dependent receptor [Dokdonella sp.]
MYRPPLVAAIAVALFSPVSAPAAEFETELEKRNEPARLGRIQVTATRVEEDATNVPIAITIVGRDQIQRQVAQTVSDLLHGEPGTYVQSTGAGQGVVIIRGLKGSEVLHLVDGFRLNNAFFRNAPNQYIALVDPLNVDRIEAVRGPMSTLYGSDAMGGVVQFLTPDPRFNGDRWEGHADLRTRYSSADESTHSRAGFSAGRRDFAISGGVSYQDVENLRVGGGETLPFTSYTQRSGDLKVYFKPAIDHEFTWSAQFSKQPSTQRYDALVPGFGQTVPDSAEFFYRPQERRFTQLHYRYGNPTAIADQIEVRLGYQKYIDNRTSRDFGTSNREIEENASTLRGVTALASKQVGDRHFISYGIEYYADTVDSFRQRLNINSGVVTARPARFPDGSTMDSLAGFITDDWKLTDSLDIVGGVRYSRFDIELPPVINGIGVKLDPDKVTGQIGFAWKLDDDLRVVGNVGQGFRAPNIFDLGTFGDRPSNRFNIPNANLKPEQVVSYDLGIKYGSDTLEYEAIAFTSRYQDKITSVLTGDVTDGGRQIVQSRNATRLNLSGVETGVRWQATPQMNLYATATYTRGEEEFEGDEYPADRIPPLFGKLGVRYGLSEKVELEGWSQYSTRQDRLSPRDATDARINPDGTAGWASVNGRVSWNIDARTRLQLAVENITDKRYREHGSGLDEPGHNVSLGVNWRF